jgi:hypothetical protein
MHINKTDRSKTSWTVRHAVKICPEAKYDVNALTCTVWQIEGLKLTSEQREFIVAHCSPASTIVRAGAQYGRN